MGKVCESASFVAGDTLEPGVNVFVLQSADGIRVVGFWCA